MTMCLRGQHESPHWMMSLYPRKLHKVAGKHRTESNLLDIFIVLYCSLFGQLFHQFIYSNSCPEGWFGVISTKGPLHHDIEPNF